MWKLNFSGAFRATRHSLESSTAIYYPFNAKLPIHWAYGWFWDVTDDIDFFVSEFIRRGRVIKVWETPQFKAIEWLVGQEKLRFPPSLDAALHGTFCRILSIQAICKNPLRHGDIVDALRRIDAASDKYVSAADDLFGIESDVIDFLSDLPSNIALSADEFNRDQSALSVTLGMMRGVLETELKHQREIYQKFTGEDLPDTSGRPANWVARFVAMQAADIYRTAFSGPVTPMAGRPSFHSFLERFAIGIPDAERADKRALARQVWNGGYVGTPFAPIV